MATTDILFALKFHDPDSDKVIPISAFGQNGKGVIKNYFTNEAFWKQAVAPVGYLKLPTIQFRNSDVVIRAKCEHSEPSAILNALLDWANDQADVVYEFGGVECKLEIQTVNVNVNAENVALVGGRSRRGLRPKPRRSRHAARKTRRFRTRR